MFYSTVVFFFVMIQINAMFMAFYRLFSLI